MGKRTIPRATRALVHQMGERGESLIAIAKAAGVERRTARTLLLQAGLRPREPLRYTDEVKARALELADAGVPYKQIARQVPACATTIKHWHDSARSVQETTRATLPRCPCTHRDECRSANLHYSYYPLRPCEGDLPLELDEAA